MGKKVKFGKVKDMIKKYGIYRTSPKQNAHYLTAVEIGFATEEHAENALRTDKGPEFNLTGCQYFILPYWENIDKEVKKAKPGRDVLFLRSLDE